MSEIILASENKNNMMKLLLLHIALVSDVSMWILIRGTKRLINHVTGIKGGTVAITKC